MTVPLHVLRAAVRAALVALILLPVAASAQQDTVPRVTKELSPRPAAAADTLLPLERLTTPEERRATGLERLTPGERRALGEWLARYTAAVAMGARLAAQAQMQAQAQPQRIDATVRVIDANPNVRTFRIVQKLWGGSYILLEDGTIWEVELNDRPLTDVWLVGAPVAVRQRPAGSNGFDTYLVNAAEGTRAAARLGGPPALFQAP